MIIALESGINVNSVDREGLTALHKATFTAQNGVKSEAKTGTVDLLLTRGADPDLRSTRGHRALDFCWNPEQEEIMRRLRQVTTDQYTTRRT